MKVYEKKIIVGKGDLDDLDHVNNVRYVQWIQDISKEHWEKAAPMEARDKMVWVVKNHNITYNAPAFLGDHLKLRTWIQKTNAALSERRVEIIHLGSGRELVCSVTQWCLLNAVTLKPIRVPEEIIRLFQ